MTILCRVLFLRIKRLICEIDRGSVLTQSPVERTRVREGGGSIPLSDVDTTSVFPAF